MYVILFQHCALFVAICCCLCCCICCFFSNFKYFNILTCAYISSSYIIQYSINCYINICYRFLFKENDHLITLKLHRTNWNPNSTALNFFPLFSIVSLAHWHRLFSLCMFFFCYSLNILPLLSCFRFSCFYDYICCCFVCAHIIQFFLYAAVW